MRPQDFRCHQRLSVRWAEVDAQKIVFNAHYLMYADVAITHYWRQLAMPYEAAFAALGGELFVKKASTVFHASATLGDVPRAARKAAAIAAWAWRASAITRPILMNSCVTPL